MPVGVTVEALPRARRCKRLCAVRAGGTGKSWARAYGVDNPNLGEPDWRAGAGLEFGLRQKDSPFRDQAKNPPAVWFGQVAEFRNKDAAAVALLTSVRPASVRGDAKLFP